MSDIKNGERVITALNELAAGSLPPYVSLDQVPAEVLKVTEGLTLLDNFPISIPSYIRAQKMTGIALNASNLTAVESALFDAISYLKSLPLNKSQGITTENVALCLYALQNLIFELPNKNLKNGAKNDYEVNVFKRLDRVKEKALNLNLDSNVFEYACLDTSYRVPSDNVLKNFDLIDPARIESVYNDLRSYERSSNPSIIEKYKSDYNREKVITNKETKEKSSVGTNLNFTGHEYDGAGKNLTDKSLYDGIEEKGFNLPKHIIEPFQQKIEEDDNRYKGVVDQGIITPVKADIPFLMKFVNIIASKYGKEILTVEYIKNHLKEFCGIVSGELGVNDAAKIAALIKAVLLNMHQINDRFNQHARSRNEPERGLSSNTSTINQPVPEFEMSAGGI